MSKLKDIARILNGNEYREELYGTTKEKLKELGIVVVYGASDDLMEFDGALYDEAGCWDGGIVELKELFDGATKKIEALWCKEENYCWTYKTNIPHETFNIVEDGELDIYCRGIVFYEKDIY